MQLEAKSIIDLTQTISENLQVYPGDPPVEVHTVSTLEDGFVLERVCMSSMEVLTWMLLGTFLRGC